MRINGDTQGLKKSVLAALEALYELHIPKESLWTKELVDEMTYISTQINREISVYIDRKGTILDVSVGSNNTVSLPEVEGKRNTYRLSGTKCIHTHPNGSGELSSLDISSLKLLRLDAMISIGIHDNIAKEIYVAIISGPDPCPVDILGPFAADKQDFQSLIELITDADKFLRQTISTNDEEQERAILVGLQKRDSKNISGTSEAEISFAELEELAKTAGAQVVGHVMQKRDARNSATLIGQGKIDELRQIVQTTDADIVIFDEELTGAQQRNIEEAIGLKVLSRTSLILDIFAQRARSREGILQVELAQLEYQLPRLVGMSQGLSRLGGGIGTRGPGETKLETDRRAIRTRITYLKEQLADVRRQRGVLRRERKKSGIPVVSIVGYTNAGKSTLLNTLCNAEVLAEDKLFATLDTTTRKLTLNDGSKVLLTDTVGFIRKLPHHLLDAFKSTLEEVVLSDLIMIVADASDPHVENHVHIVDDILTQLGAGTKPTLIVLNKIDKLSESTTMNLLQKDRTIIEISAKQGYGLDMLKDAIKNVLFTNNIQIKLSVPFTDGAAMAWLHANSKILDISYGESSTFVDVEIDRRITSKISHYIQGE